MPIATLNTSLNASNHRLDDKNSHSDIKLYCQPLLGGWLYLEWRAKMESTRPPDLGSNRLARLSDVPRMAIAAAAGFWHSPVFQYERPHSNRYPNDTLASYRRLYQQAILDPKSVVLVVEDGYRKDEVTNAYDALSIVYPPLQDQLPPEQMESDSVIVGVGSVSLQAAKSRYGLVQPEGTFRAGSFLVGLGQ